VKVSPSTAGRPPNDLRRFWALIIAQYSLGATSKLTATGTL
jgi:hypothetical protein